MSWKNVSRSEPCPVCQRPDWCSVSADGAMCFCHRVESPYPAKSGTGWIHRLKEGGTRWSRPYAPAAATSAALPALDFARIHACYDTDPILVEGLATTLGVDDRALKAMDVRFNRIDECWSFPMRDAEGRIVGLRFRELGGSRKWSARGSRDGLFYVESKKEEGKVKKYGVELIIVEGPSDTAALLSLFDQQPTANHQLPTIVGRSSCQTGGLLLRQYIRRIRPRCVTIVADNDEPGVKGAELLAAQLRQSNNPSNQTISPPLRILTVPHPHKDLRAWYLNGKLTVKLFTDMLSAQRWR